VLQKTEAEALRLGASSSVIASAYRALIEASIEHELERFDSVKASARR